jgi:NAD-dependent SIR2 family protein deacetylase
MERVQDEKLNSSTGEMFKRNCEHCKTETLQTVELYNPDNPDEGEVWQCSVCKENTDWVST